MTAGWRCDAPRGGTATRQMALPAPLRRFHRVVLRTILSTGLLPHRDQLGHDADQLNLDLTEALRQLAGADLVHTTPDGHVVVAYPFSGQPRGYSVRLAKGPTVQAMCAIDALGIPLMAGGDGVITATDPDSNKTIRIEREHERWQWDPPTTVVLLARRGSGGPAAECLCPSITFRADHNHAARQLAADPLLDGAILDQANAIEAARSFFGSLLIE
jgi:Alkylmercury lyase